MKKRNVFAMLMALVMSMSLVACGGGSAEEPAPEKEEPQTSESTAAPEASESDLAYIEGKGNMVIGYTVYAPMNYTDDNGEFVGFDTELAIAVCEKLGVEPGSTTPDGKYTLEATRCIGACGLAPVLTINNDVYGRLTTADLDGILEKYM